MYILTVRESDFRSGRPVLSRSSVYLFVKFDWRSDRNSGPHPNTSTALKSAIVVETHDYLDIGLPSRSWNAIQLPCTYSVTRGDSSNIGEGIKPLLLVIIVRGAATQQEYNRVCEQCEKRIGNKTGPPGLIDFHGPCLTAQRGMAQVHLTISCYSRHHRKEDEQYVYPAVAQ